MRTPPSTAESTTTHHEGAEQPHVKKVPGDILYSPHLITFLLGYIKEMKNESGFVIQISQHTLALLDSFKHSIDQLPKLSED